MAELGVRAGDAELEKLLLQKRFEERLGQRETARALGVSQMQVSRMERRLLNAAAGENDDGSAVIPRHW